MEHQCEKAIKLISQLKRLLPHIFLSSTGPVYEAHVLLLKIEDMVAMRYAALAHIRKIPNEVLSIIFKAGCSLPVKKGKLPFSVLVSHVSRHWRAVAIGTPFLWVDVKISSAQSLGRPAAFLQRSKACLLNIHIRIHEGRKYPLERAMALILPHVSRWRRLTCINYGTQDFSIPTLLLRDVHAPSLEYLHIFSYTKTRTSPSIEHKILKGGAPLLSTVRLPGFHLTRCLPSMFNITTLELNHSSPTTNYFELRDVLLATPVLARLILRGTDIRLSSTIDYPGVDLPCLVSLEMQEPLEFFWRICSLFYMPVIHSLQFSAYWRKQVPLGRLVSHASNYSALTSLKIMDYSDCYGQCSEDAEWFFRTFPAITDLTLETRCCGDCSLDNILELLTQELDLDSTYYFPLDSFPHWPNLRNLTVDCVDEYVLHEFLVERIRIGAPVLRLRLLSRDPVESRSRMEPLGDLVELEVLEHTNQWCFSDDFSDSEDVFIDSDDLPTFRSNSSDDDGEA